MAQFNGKVCVIGIWHLGAVVSTCLADLGYSVIGVDTNRERVDRLNDGKPPLFEPGLEELLARGLEKQRLSYTTDLSGAVKGCSYAIIAFDTPVNEKDEADLSPVFEAAAGLGRSMERGTTVIVTSQVPVGTCDIIKEMIKRENPSLDFDIACNPENLRLGQAIGRFMHPDRIVIGADDPSTLDKVEWLFGVIDSPKLRMSLKSAEMTKHAINVFLAGCISFANEIGNLCDEVGADGLSVAEGLGTEERIGPRLPLKPGLAFAGGTLARDLKILQVIGDERKSETYFVDAVLKVNERQKTVVMRKLKKICGAIDKLTVGVLGLTYKAGTSTLRRSAALELTQNLVMAGALVKVWDPKADVNEVRAHAEFEFCADPYAVAQGSDAIVFMTDWPEFTRLDFSRIKTSMNNPVIIDAMNMLNGPGLVDQGFAYAGIGRGTDHEITR